MMILRQDSLLWKGVIGVNKDPLTSTSAVFLTAHPYKNETFHNL
jgi:hypothetical protein